MAYLAVLLSRPKTDYLADVGYDPAYGARPLQRAVRKELETPVRLAGLYLQLPGIVAGIELQISFTFSSLRRDVGWAALLIYFAIWCADGTRTALRQYF